PYTTLFRSADIASHLREPRAHGSGQLAAVCRFSLSIETEDMPPVRSQGEGDRSPDAARSARNDHRAAPRCSLARAHLPNLEASGGRFSAKADASSAASSLSK